MTDWETIIARNRDALQSTAWRLLGNHADVADCLQEAFLEALSVSKKRRIRNWRGFLQWLVVHRALDCLRQRGRESRCHGTPVDLTTVTSPNPGPVEEAQMRDVIAKLRQALTELPAQQADAFCLRYLSGLSYRAIGRELGLKTSTVGTLLHRSRNALAALLNESGAKALEVGR